MKQGALSKQAFAWTSLCGRAVVVDEAIYRNNASERVFYGGKHQWDVRAHCA
jgi:hypothetical protein